MLNKKSSFQEPVNSTNPFKNSPQILCGLPSSPNPESPLTLNLPGGLYYIISRSLGPEFGASVGVVFAFANAVSASMNTIGFCISLNDLLNSRGIPLIDGDIQNVRVIGTVAILVMVLICALGMDWEAKAQNFLIAVIMIAMFDFMLGTIIGPVNDEQIAKGFVGFSCEVEKGGGGFVDQAGCFADEVFSTNWVANYRVQQNVNYDFFQVFAIFFPSVTGIQAGANISGDLKVRDYFSQK